MNDDIEKILCGEKVETIQYVTEKRDDKTYVWGYKYVEYLSPAFPEFKVTEHKYKWLERIE